MMTARSKLGVLAITCLMALGLRFFWLGAEEAHWFQANLGYAFVFVLVSIWLVLYARCGLMRCHLGGTDLRAKLVPFGVIAIATLFVHIHEPHVFRVLYDEPTHALGSMVMHLKKQALWSMQSNWVGDRFLLSGEYASFRQYLFPFLVSLIHDFTGYRIGNVFVLNFVLTPIILFNAYFLGRRLAGELAGLAAVGLLATLPLFAQVMCSGSYDGLNLALIGGLVLLTLAYWESEDSRRRLLMDLSLATALLLVLARSESILYLIPWGLVTALLWWRERKVTLTVFAMVSPVFTLPNLLSTLLTFGNNGAMYGYLRKNGEAFFDVAYLPRHVSEAIYYLYDFDLNCTASVLLSVLGLVGIVGFLVRAGRRMARRQMQPEEGVVGFYAIWIGVVYLFVLTQFWSSPTDFMASRFILPVLFVFAIMGGWLIMEIRWLASRPAWIGSGIVAWAVVAAAPAASRAFATYDMTAPRSEEWFFEYAEKRDPRTTLYLEKSNVAWVARRYAASCLNRLGAEPSVYVRALKAGLYRDVIVCQVLEAQPNRGVWAPAPGHELPESVVLETIEERTMSPIYKARISRLVGYRNKAGMLVTPGSDDPEIATKQIKTGADDWYAYWVSLYP